MNNFDDEDTTSRHLSLEPIDTARTAYLLVLTSATPSLVGRTFKLGKAENIVGRGKGVDVALDEGTVSRHHAKLIRVTAVEYMLVDLGSRNGVLVNGTPIKDPVPLKDGDKVQVGATTILLFTLRDAVEEQFHQNLYEAATRDGLTAVFNRKYFLDVLRADFAYGRRHESPLAVLMMDIDRFKQFNDTHGHLAGDEVLSQLARCVGKTLRQEDVFARVGGEEFAILLRESTPEAALACAERCRKAVEQLKVTFQDKELSTTVSIGAAVLIKGSDTSPEQLVERADKALYRAKEEGRNRVACDSTLAAPTR